VKKMYIFKHWVVLVIGYAFGFLKHARWKILLCSAFHDLFLVNLLSWRKGRQVAKVAPWAGSSCSIPSECVENLREKVLGIQLKESALRCRRDGRCLLKKVPQIRPALSWASFVLRFYDLAFLYFQWFGQVGSLVTVQIWQCMQSWWFYVIS